MPAATVRWFDTDRGFGFLAPEDGSDDVFVHASEVLGGDGVRTLREGQAVDFELGEGPRGPQALRVRVTGDVAPDAALGVLGLVAWFEPTKGYGFLMVDGGGPQVFVHGSAVVGGAVLVEGQRVAYLVGEGEKGPQAEHVLPLAASAAPAGPAAADGADGTVSWFDAEKGFGFVAPDDGGPDVFVHVRQLADGLAALEEGDRVTYEVAPGDRGPQAQDVRVVGGAGRRGPAGRDRGARGAASGARGARGGAPRSAVPARGGEGVVARYDVERGFGFIRPDSGGDDLFVHISVVRGADGLEEGDRVRFGVRQSDRGPQADRVERL
ncbi:cold shock domain-containing protein [uncultured Pseudokineococcus sp.]|uniref:cold-shock protein n=1 Tax=uncultured Pseudokineococcus sp. TaxID=1642928 RepID=UPI003447ED13